MNVPNGETNLQQLLASMQPLLADSTYVFASLSDAELERVNLKHIAVLVREREGTTVVLASEVAKGYSFSTSAEFAMITLQVHSSLEAVGLTAAFAKALGEQAISANVVAGYFHDHIFVAASDSAAAMQALQTLATKHGAVDKSDADSI